MEQNDTGLTCSKAHSGDPWFLMPDHPRGVVWALEACYEQSKTEIDSIVHKLLTNKQLVVEGFDLVYLALKRFSAG